MRLQSEKERESQVFDVLVGMGDAVSERLLFWTCVSESKKTVYELSDVERPREYPSLLLH